MIKHNEEILLNFVSPHEFRYFRGTDNYDVLVTNYAVNLAKRVGTTCDIRNFMGEVFGECWYEVPYQQLYKVAKLTLKRHAYKGGVYCRRQANIKSVHLAQNGLRRIESIYDSTICRVCKRYYKTSLIDEIISEDARLNTPARGYMSVENELKNLAEIAAAIRKYDKKDIKKLKQVDKTGLRDINRDCSELLKYTVGFYKEDLKATMTASQVSKLIKGQAEAFVQKYVSLDADERAWGTIKSHFAERMVYRYSRANCWHTPTQSVIRAAVRASKEYEKVAELERITNKLGLSLTGGERGNMPYMTWQIAKVDSKICRLAKELERAFDSGTDADIVRELAHQRSYAIYRSNYTRSIYAPIFLVNNK